MTANPVRDASARLNTSAKKAPRALTVKETTRLVELFSSSPRAAELDLADLVDWMLATGARIGEALALSSGQTAGRSLLDPDAGTWEVNATVVRVPKQGLVVQPRPRPPPVGGSSRSLTSRSGCWRTGGRDVAGSRVRRSSSSRR